MQKELWKLIRGLLFFLLLILATIAIWMLVLKITDHSPDAITIVSWVVGVILTFQILVITILLQIKEDLGNLKEFKRQTINKINKLDKK